MCQSKKKMLMLGLAALFLALPGLTWAHSCPITKCGRCYEYVHSTSNVTCNGGYTCQKHECVFNDACSDPCCINILYCQAPSNLPTAAVNAVADKVLDLLTQPAYADYTECDVASGYCFGYRDASNKSGGGTLKPCAARLHVCFTNGTYDSALSGVDTTQECDNTCDTNNSPSQIACSYTDCQDRCYCGLANTSCPCN